MKILHTTRLPQPPSSLNPKLPNALNAVLLRALAKNPFERFPSVQHFMQALQQC
jgi:serine/threonine-protein kinase